MTARERAQALRDDPDTPEAWNAVALRDVLWAWLDEEDARDEWARSLLEAMPEDDDDSP